MDGSSEEFKALISDEELKGIFDELEHWGNCVGLYMHGSTIFLNHQPNDLDLIAIVDGAKRLIDPNTKESQFILGRCEVSVYTREFFLDRLEAMDMTMLTCLSTPARFIIKGLEDDRVRNFQLKLDVLEEQTASYADYTWLKSHRLLDRTKVLYKACKNTYFSFRLLDFGCQLVETGRIPDLAAANGIYDCAKQIWELLQIQPGDWDVVEAVFGHHFEMMRKKFQLSMEAAKLGRVELPQEPQPEDTEPEESCSLCGCQMDGSQKNAGISSARETNVSKTTLKQLERLPVLPAANACPSQSAMPQAAAQLFTGCSSNCECPAPGWAYDDEGAVARDELADRGILGGSNPVTVKPVGGAAFVFNECCGREYWFQTVLEDQWKSGSRFKTVALIYAGNDLGRTDNQVVVRLVDIVGRSYFPVPRSSKKGP
eukprot:s321_g15.t1